MYVCVCMYVIRSELDIMAVITEIRLDSILKSLQHVCGSFYEGLSLVLTHMYVLKLAGISCLYEVVLTILDFEFKVSTILYLVGKVYVFMKCYRIHTINKLNDIDFLIVVIHTSALLTAHLNNIFYAYFHTYIHTYKHTYILVDLGRASFVIDQLNFGRLRKSAWSIRSG